MKLLNIGFGNMVNADRIIGIVSPDSAPIKRLVQDAREKVELQVNQSVYKVNEANKKLIASTRNMENAEENLRHANLGFEEGVIPALNLMQAQTAWVSARSSLIDAQIEVKLTEVYLTKAMGKLKVEN